jgi:hypothetical protein
MALRLHDFTKSDGLLTNHMQVPKARVWWTNAYAYWWAKSIASALGVGST